MQVGDFSPLHFSSFNDLLDLRGGAIRAIRSRSGLAVRRGGCATSPKLPISPMGSTEVSVMAALGLLDVLRCAGCT